MDGHWQLILINTSPPDSASEYIFQYINVAHGLHSTLSTGDTVISCRRTQQVLPNPFLNKSSHRTNLWFIVYLVNATDAPAVETITPPRHRAQASMTTTGNNNKPQQQKKTQRNLGWIKLVACLWSIRTVNHHAVDMCANRPTRR